MEDEGGVVVRIVVNGGGEVMSRRIKKGRKRVNGGLGRGGEEGGGKGGFNGVDGVNNERGRIR